MRFTFTVEVEVQRDEGKFASRDEIADQIREALEGADEGSWDGENGGVYSTADWSVNEEAKPEPAPRRPRKKAAPEPNPLVKMFDDAAAKAHEIDAAVFSDNFDPAVIRADDGTYHDLPPRQP